MVADEHPAVSRRDPLVWLGAGVVTLGVGTALLSGAGVATADTGSSPTNSHTTNATEKSAPTDPPGSRSGRGVARPTAGITGTPKTAGATRTAQRPTALSSRKRDTPRWQATSLAVATSLGAAKPGADAVTTVASATAAASPWDTITGAVNGFVSGVKKFVDDTVVAVSNTVRATSVVALGAVIPRLSVIPGLSQLVDAVAQLGPSTPASRLYRTLRYLTATDADGIVVNTVTGADNQKRLVVYLGGTVPFSSTNQPAVDNLVGWNGSAKTNQLNVVLTALQGDKTKPVMLVGYSQGGMDAQNLAQALAGMGYNVKAVVGFGSPIVRTPGTGYESVFLADILDPVAALRQGGVSVARDQVFTGISSSALNPGFGNLNVHARITTYEQIGRQFNSAAGYSDVRRIIRQFEDVNGAATPAFSEWLGTWSAGGVTLPAYVVLVNTDPVYGMISVGGGQCVATWNEAGRISNTERYVNADVTQGSCVDNQWHVTISGNRISGTDASGANASFSVKRR